MLSVVTAGFGEMFFRVAGMAVRAVSMMRCLFVIASFVMLGGFTMMLGGMLMMLGGLVMMLNACLIAHRCSPGSISGNAG